MPIQSIGVPVDEPRFGSLPNDPESLGMMSGTYSVIACAFQTTGQRVVDIINAAVPDADRPAYWHSVKCWLYEDGTGETLDVPIGWGTTAGVTATTSQQTSVQQYISGAEASSLYFIGIGSATTGRLIGLR